MVITKEVHLPEYEELKTQECNLSATTLMAAGPYIGKQCESINNEFMLCRQETGDPRACLALGKRVTQCTLNALRAIKKECLKEFNQYSNCIDKSSGNYSFRYCRNTQEVFDECMCKKLKISRPDFGYFCRGRIHTSPSNPPAAPDCPCYPCMPDATPGLPDCKPRIPSRFGGRLYWTNE